MMEEVGVSQETKTEINFESLRTIVDDAIKNKNTSAIEVIEDEKQLRYMQKYAELLVSKDEISVGIYGYVLTLIAIGVSYLLVNPPNFTKLMSPYSGFLIIIFGLIVMFFWKRKYKPEIEFMHEIILKIEEKLSNKTSDYTNIHSSKLTNAEVANSKK